MPSWPSRASLTRAWADRATAISRSLAPATTKPIPFLMPLRAGTSPLLDLLDCPDPSVATPQRTVTSTPMQALALLNNRFMEHHAERFAERLKREAPEGTAAQVGRAYALAFSVESPSSCGQRSSQYEQNALRTV